MLPHSRSGTQQAHKHTTINPGMPVARHTFLGPGSPWGGSRGNPSRGGRRRVAVCSGLGSLSPCFSLVLFLSVTLSLCFVSLSNTNNSFLHLSLSPSDLCPSLSVSVSVSLSLTHIHTHRSTHLKTHREGSPHCPQPFSCPSPGPGQLLGRLEH